MVVEQRIVEFSWFAGRGMVEQKNFGLFLVHTLLLAKELLVHFIDF